MPDQELVSVIIPCLNEEKFISKCLDSVLSNTYSRDLLEVFVIDGMSLDKTIEIVKEYENKHPFIRLLTNPKSLTPAALNIGIKASKGKIIVRLDAHTTYQPDYIEKCVNALHEYDAANAGGIIHTVSARNTPISKAISLSIAHPFGVGRSHFRLAKRNLPYHYVDTVPFGCFRREIFEEVGFFDEKLPSWRGRCNEDQELNKRIREAGKKIVLVTDIVSHYYSRESLKEFWEHNFNNGYLVTMPLGSGSNPLSLRHFVPFTFVIGLLTLPILGLAHPLAWYVLAIMLITYMSLNLYFSFKAAIRQKSGLYFFFMPFIFTILHVSYGLGSIKGLISGLKIRLGKK